MKKMISVMASIMMATGMVSGIKAKAYSKEMEPKAWSTEEIAASPMSWFVYYARRCENKTCSDEYEHGRVGVLVSEKNHTYMTVEFVYNCEGSHATGVTYELADWLK